MNLVTYREASCESKCVGIYVCICPQRYDTVFTIILRMILLRVPYFCLGSYNCFQGISFLLSALGTQWKCVIEQVSTQGDPICCHVKV